MNSKRQMIRLTEQDLHRIVKESVNRILSEGDRHREGYWKERWEKQKAERANMKGTNDVKKPSKPKKDRHRDGYWEERWAKQKAAKRTETEKNADAPQKPQKQASKPKKDRHRKGYYKEYNRKHPERLNRGFTKGYVNGNVDDGKIGGKDERIWLGPDIYIKGYDEFGRPITNNPFGDMLRNKEMEWHDDDWDEGSWDD